MNLVTKNHSQDYATSIKIDVMYRILEVLCNSGPKKITNLAMLSGLNHITCKKYSNLMKMLTWVEITKEKKSTVISVTEQGKKLWDAMQNV
jgi:predicted transcriptional regulator